MTIDEFTHVVESNGVNPARWPAHLQRRCKDFLTSSAEAQRLIAQHLQLESQLDRLPVPEFPGLESRVLGQLLPRRAGSVPERLLAWLLPGHPLGRQVWRPAMAACLPLVFGILLGNYFSFGVFTEDDGFDYWKDELALLSLDDYTENSFQP